MAAAHCPEPCDWRTRVISNLLSPRDDPQYYRLPSLGIALAGLLMLPLARYGTVRLAAASKPWARAGGGAFAAGLVALTLSALVVPQHVRLTLGFHRLHEFLARLSALGIACAMLCCCLCAALDRRRPGGRRLDARLLPLWLLLTLPPIAGVLTSEALLLLAGAHAPWSGALREALRGAVVWWHLGSWEWVASAKVFLFLLVSVLLLPALRPCSKPSLLRPAT